MGEDAKAEGEEKVRNDGGLQTMEWLKPRKPLKCRARHPQLRLMLLLPWPKKQRPEAKEMSESANACQTLMLRPLKITV